MCAVTRLKAGDREQVAGFHRLASDTAARKRVDAQQLDRPLNAVAFRVERFEMHPSMGVGPFDLRYRAGDLDRLADIELCRKGMVCIRVNPGEGERKRSRN